MSSRCSRNRWTATTIRLTSMWVWLSGLPTRWTMPPTMWRRRSRASRSRVRVRRDQRERGNGGRAEHAERGSELPTKAQCAVTFGHGDAALRSGHHRVSRSGIDGAGITPPAAGAARSKRSTPRRSVSAVRGMFTRESVSSTHSTGTSLNPQAGALRKHEQLRVEEPALVTDSGQQGVRNLRRVWL